MFEWFADPVERPWPDVHQALGREYLLTDADQLTSPLTAAHLTGGPSAPVGHSGGGAGSPASTLVGAPGGLQINLEWDASVRSAASWAAIESAVVSAAGIYASEFANHLTLNIEVGLGEVAGSKMSSGALGESESTGYLTSYGTITGALARHDSALVQAGEASAGAFADGALQGDSFFVPSAEAKALGLVHATASGVDGYIGLNASASTLYFPSSGGHIGAGQYDAVGVAAHELSEVMGRLGMEGSKLGSTSHVYTALDLFRFSAPGTPDLTPGAGYFSTDLGQTSILAYNNPSDGGDASDWAGGRGAAADAYNAFGRPGAMTTLSSADLLEDALLGFQLAPGKAPGPVAA